MAYFLSAHGIAHLRDNDAEVMVTVSDASTGAPVEDLSSGNFDIRFVGQTADIQHFEDYGPGIYRMRVTWPGLSEGLGWGQPGFYHLTASVKKNRIARPTDNPRGTALPAPGGLAGTLSELSQEVFLGQTVCPLWVDEQV